MQKLLLLVLLLPCFLQSKSQWYDPEKVNHKATTIYLLAINKAQNGDLVNSVKMINEALKIEPKFVDAYLSLAGINADLKDYSASVSYFEKAFSLDSVYTNYYLLPYSISLAGCGRFSDALNAVNIFLKNPKINQRSINAGEFRKKTYQFAIDYAKSHPDTGYIFAPKNLGDSINTTALEYFPSLTIDGKKLIFTRRQNNKETFYESDLENGNWGKAFPLVGKINSPDFNVGAQNISQDGEWLVFTGCNFPGDLEVVTFIFLILLKMDGANHRTWEETLILSFGNPVLLFHQIKKIFISAATDLAAMAEKIFGFATEMKKDIGASRKIWDLI